MTEQVASALSYSRRGWRVFPLCGGTVDAADQCDCLPAARSTSYAGVPCYMTQATTDLETIISWWHSSSINTIGIATGAGLLVLDIDASCASLDSVMDFYALPDTAIVCRPNRGWQLFYTYNPALRLLNTCDKLGSGIRSFADDCYVVVPSYLTSTCRDYNQPYWLHYDQPVRLPSALLPALLSKRPAVREWLPGEAEQPSIAARRLAAILLQQPSLGLWDVDGADEYDDEG
jgi:hypothetical protein